MVSRTVYCVLVSSLLVTIGACAQDDLADAVGNEVDDRTTVRDRSNGVPGTPVDLPACNAQADCPYSNSICYVDDGPGYCTVGCEGNNDCPGGGSQLCESGICIPTCADDSACPNGYGCEASACVATEVGDDPLNPDTDPLDDPVSVEITNFGAPCAANIDCINADIDPSVVCLTAIPGGYCSVACELHSECGSTANCGLEPAPGQLFCGLQCSSDTDCGRPLELGCDMSMGSPICTDLTLIDPVVDDPDPIDDPDPPVTGSVLAGEACALDTECALGSLSDNRCFTNSQGWPGGYCAAFGCYADSDCGADAFCGRGTAPDAIGLCIKSCAVTCDRPGYTCFPGADGSPGLCLPSTLPDPALDPPNVGSACTISDQCTMGNGVADPARVCIPPKWPDGALGFPDGYCSAINCTPGGSDCGTSNTCVTLPADPDDALSLDVHLCLESCPAIGMQSSCRTGYSCTDVGGPLGVCWVAE